MADEIDEMLPDENEMPSEELEGAPAPRRRDPVQRWLMIVVGLVLVVFVGTAVSLVLYVLSMRDAPRTAVEQALTTDEVAAREHPDVIENWARLALSYAEAHQWTDAMNAIQRGRRIKQAAILDLTQADILRLKGDKAAVEAYDLAMKTGQSEYEEKVEKLKQSAGVSVPPANTLVFEAMFGRALALDMLGRTQEAVDQAQKALAIDPTDSDLRVALAAMYLKLGKRAEAEAQYRQALVYVPDLKSAKDGLKKLGKEN